jgi:hypothetical protein
MKNIQKSVLAVLSAVVMVIGSGQFLSAQEPAMLTGELISVNTEASVITVRTEAGDELEFRYTAQTEVTGAQESVEGLATMSGATVTVHHSYDEDTKSHTATRIEVNPGG